HKQENNGKKAKALISFSLMKDDELWVATEIIVTAMKNNDRFPELTPELSSIQNLLDDFTFKLTRARKHRSRKDIILKNESKKLLIEALQKLGYYVNFIANRHLPTILNSGFPINASYS